MGGDTKKAAKLEVNYKNPEVVKQRAEMMDLLKPASGERILDVGCGPGLFMNELLESVGKDGFVEGIEVSEAMKSLADARLSHASNASVRLADAESLPYEDGSF